MQIVLQKDHDQHPQFIPAVFLRCILFPISRSDFHSVQHNVGDFEKLFGGDRFSAAEQTLQFPKLAQNVTVFSYSERMFDGECFLWGQIRVVEPQDKARIFRSQPFLCSPLNFSDEVIFQERKPREFVMNVSHAKTSKKGPCMVRCADGASSQDCITCVDEDVTVRLCC